MSAKVACPRCGCAEIDKDAATGGSYCTNCGSVLEENKIVAEVEFFETGTGGHGALGQFVSADAPSNLRIGSMPGISAKESREVTLQRARRMIGELASQLGGLNQHCKDTAVNFFSMALRSGLTRGRRSTHVIAACLYITCRLEGTPHLLLDFSDALQVNVYELGRVYNFLARKLLIRLPQLDPCDYIMRFAHCLKFGDKEHDVAMVALRLVQRMKRDWMALGRRPTGLCGAALLLAARYHNFRRTVNDIIQVVNISETVVRKRLEEFASTPSSELTLDEFQTVDLEHTCDPPAFREARSKAKRNQQPKQHQQANSEDGDELWGDRFKAVEKELLATQAAVDAALSDASQSKHHPMAKYAKVPNGENYTKTPRLTRSHASEDHEEQQAQQFVEEQLLPDIIATEDGAAATAEGSVQEQETPAEKYRALRPTLESLGITKSLGTRDATTTTEDGDAVDEEGDDLRTDDIDDAEIDSYLLNSDEVQMKQELWMANYEEFVVEMEEKRKVKEEKLKEEQESGTKKKKPIVRKKKPVMSMEPASSTNEAIEKIVQEKKLSNKINYEVLKSLVVVTDSPKDDGETVALESTSEPGPTKMASRRPLRRFKPFVPKKA